MEKLFKYTEHAPRESLGRRVDINVIGDSHGNEQAFRLNLLDLELITDIGNRAKQAIAVDIPPLEWRGGNQQVFVLGDILADRNSGGFEILEMYQQLKPQARASGGDLHLIQGNHDDFMLSFLTDTNCADGGAPIDVFKACKQAGYIGINEVRGLTEEGLEKPVSSDFSSKKLNVIFNSERGHRLVKAMCEFKLFERIDDLLFIHTNPTAQIVDEIIHCDDSAAINGFYQEYLRYLFWGESKPSSPFREINSDDYFERLKIIFLRTSNREDFWRLGEVFEFPQHELITGLRNKGINQIYHGHTDEGDGGVKEIREDFYKKSGLWVQSVDTSFGKRGYVSSDCKPATLKIKKTHRGESP